MRPHHGTQHIMGIRHPVGPFPHGFIHRILQGLRSAGYRMHLCAKQLHPVYVQRLSVRILLPHKNLALHAQQRRGRSGCHPMLPCSGLRDHPGFSHLFGHEHLAQHIVDLVGSGVVQILPLQINLRAAQIPGHLFRIVQKGRPAGIFLLQTIQLLQEIRILFIKFIAFLQADQFIHQGF